MGYSQSNPGAPLALGLGLLSTEEVQSPSNSSSSNKMRVVPSICFHGNSKVLTLGWRDQPSPLCVLAVGRGGPFLPVADTNSWADSEDN